MNSGCSHRSCQPWPIDMQGKPRKIPGRSMTDKTARTVLPQWACMQICNWPCSSGADQDFYIVINTQLQVSRKQKLAWGNQESIDQANLNGCLKLCNFPDLQHPDMPELLSVSATEEQADKQSARHEVARSVFFLHWWLFICLLIRSFCNWDCKKFRHVWALQIWAIVCRHHWVRKYMTRSRVLLVVRWFDYMLL